MTAVEQALEALRFYAGNWSYEWEEPSEALLSDVGARARSAIAALEAEGGEMPPAISTGIGYGRNDPEYLASVQAEQRRIASPTEEQVERASLFDAIKLALIHVHNEQGCTWEQLVPEAESVIKMARNLAGMPPLAAVLPDAEGWRPISTAPKDGTRVLVAEKLENNYWDVWLDHQRVFADYTEGFGHGRPTHWRPLPATPKEKADE